MKRPDSRTRWIARGSSSPRPRCEAWTSTRGTFARLISFSKEGAQEGRRRVFFPIARHAFQVKPAVPAEEMAVRGRLVVVHDFGVRHPEHFPSLLVHAVAPV